MRFLHNHSQQLCLISVLDPVAVSLNQEPKNDGHHTYYECRPTMMNDEVENFFVSPAQDSDHVISGPPPPTPGTTAYLFRL